jgi:PAS domain S-box-containing protein/putative nucleotidyltransferase with HDIG domain
MNQDRCNKYQFCRWAFDPEIIRALHEAKTEDSSLIDAEYSIQDLVDIDRLREIFENFSSITGYTAALIDFPSQEILIATGWRDICSKFHHACPESLKQCEISNVYLTENLTKLKEINIRKCEHGLINGATPIIIRGKHLANVVAGQAFFKEPEIDQFERQAQLFGYDVNKYLEELRKVPVVTETQFKATLSFLSELAVMIAGQGLSNLGLQKTTTELDEEILERKKMEVLLLKSREMLRGLLDATPEAVLLLDRGGIVLAGNEVAAQRLGKTIKDLVGACIFDFLPPDVAATRREHLDEAVRTKRLVHFADCREDRWFEHFLRPVANSAGEIEEVAILTLDNTERRRTEAELKLKERLLDGASDSIFLHDLEGNLLYLNEAAYKSRGYAKEELLAAGVSILPTREYAAQRPQLIEELLEKGEIIFKSAHLHKDRAIIPVEIHARLLELDDRRLVLSVTRDIAARQQAAAALCASEEKFRLLIRNLPAVAFLGYADGAIDLFDNKIEQLTGYSQEEFSSGLNWISLIQKEDLATAKEQFLQALRTDRSYVREYRIKTKDARSLWIQERSHIICDPEGKILSINGVLFDITERRHAEEQIKNLNILLKAIKEIDEALLRIKSEAQLFQSTCDLLTNIPYVRCAWIGLVEPDSFEVKPVAWAGVEEGYLSIVKVRWDDSEFGRGPSGDAMRTGKPFVRKCIETDPEPNPWRQEALNRGYKSSITCPLIHERGVIGILKVYAGVPNAFRDEEITFFNQVAGDIAVGIRSLRLAQGLEQSVKQLQVMMEQTIETISAILEMRDPYTAGHQRGVTKLSCSLAAELGLDEDRIAGLRVAGFLHDIGKIAVPAEILNKPGNLSKYEMNIIRAHSQVGHDILRKITFPWPVADIVLQHHERLDGSGYPQGLSGPDILMEAKILAVADTVEAMASHRPYRAALGIESALAEITKNKGVLYAPEVVTACIQLFTEKEFSFEA